MKQKKRDIYIIIVCQFFLGHRGPVTPIFFTGFPGVQIHCELGRSHEKCGENDEIAMGVASYGLEFIGRGALPKGGKPVV